MIRSIQIRTAILTFVFALFSACALRATKDISREAFLRPYIDDLKKSTPQADLNRIRDMGKSELILLLHGYGTGIRNRWIHGERDPKLAKFFHDNRVDDPEGASMVIIEALWYDLNKNLTSEERDRIETKRALVSRKRASYEKLEAQCRSQLAKARNEFELCYAKYGLPSKNPLNRDPFFTMSVDRTGTVKEIVFFQGASADLTNCLTERLRKFKFRSFENDEKVTLYILEFPNCRVEERDSLHK